MPAKPIGPIYGGEEAKKLAAEHGWAIARDGASFRRVVPSPEPREIVELESIIHLVSGGHVVLCAGGGPVVRRGRRLAGVEAVLDKDLTAGLLAEQLGADRLLMLTDVAHVGRDWGTAEARPIAAAMPRELRRLEFAAGSMGPKIEAACRFVEATGDEAAIGSLDTIAAVAAGLSGRRSRSGRAPAVRGLFARETAVPLELEPAGAARSSAAPSPPSRSGHDREGQLLQAAERID